MEIKMKKIIWTIIISIILLILFIFQWIPLKCAVNIKANTETAILIKPQKVTGFDWKIINVDGIGIEDIFLVGNIPTKKLKRKVISGHNIFLCQGFFTQKKEFNGQEYRTFYVENWDIVAPIKRDTILPEFLYPSKYLTMADFTLIPR